MNYKIFGTFIGINKYKSADVSNLTGATRDAQALWALFSDTFPGMDAELLTDEEASCASIQSALSKTLGMAGENDIVLVSFSGHGTKNHRLAAHDSIPAQLELTTIPMEFLSNLFTKSKAKIIICILDCCFSGGAPAKVFEASPVPRDIEDPFQKLQGKGRILLAASSATQVAYEQPGVGHGLLTEAIIRILKSPQPEIDITTAIYEITNIVQAEAVRIGIIQTPVVLSLIEGCLKLPSLREGEKYLSLFPPERRITISKELQNLTQFGIPDVVVQEWQNKFLNGLNSLQLKAINDHKILAGESLLVVAPTSSGKTFIGEIAAIKAVSVGKKTIFLLPYKALVNEKYEEFSAVYEAKLGMSIIRCTGDYSDQRASFIRGKYDLALLTYEMFLNLTVTNPSTLNQIGLIVLDEAQFVTDSSRGINIELILTYLITAREKGVSPQIIALSAVIGNVNKFDAWLKLNLLISNDRPVPLLEGAIDRTGKYLYRDVDGGIKELQLIPSHAIKVRKDKAGAQDVIVPLTRYLVANDESVLIFRNQRGSAQGCASYLAADLGLPPATNALQKLPNFDQSSASMSLRNCLRGGTAFHTSHLSREERQVIENAFRDAGGAIKVLSATTTVAAGINTPASTVIIAEQKFIGEDGRGFTVAEYKNMAGRAGRLGFKEVGRSIILAESTTQRNQLFDKYVMGEPEHLKSSFNPKDLNTWVIRLLSQVKCILKKDVATLLANTYGGYLATVSDASWPQKMEGQITNLTSQMLLHGLIEEESDQIQLTPLGRACGSSSLSFASALRLVALVKEFSTHQIKGITLIALIQGLEESDTLYTPFAKKSGEQKRINQAINRYGKQVITALYKYSGHIDIYQARCKRASIVFDWMLGTPIENIEKEFSYNRYQGVIEAGHIRNFADNTRFHLRPAFQIAALIAPESLCAEQELDSLLMQLEAGLPNEGLELLKISTTLTRGEHLKLLNNNIHGPTDLWNIPKEQLIQILGHEKVIDLDRLRPA